MDEVLRREEKYWLSMQEAASYMHTFHQLLRTDAFSQSGSYMVRSLYFDTIDDKDFFDKIREQNMRRKIRLRIYHPNDSFAKLELKQKENVFQKKRSLSIRKEDALALIEGDHSVLLQYHTSFADELFYLMTSECYQPKTIVEYRRKAFFAPENNIRITFDSEITATESSFSLFSDHLLLTPVFDLDKVIFEIKYNQFMLSYLADIVSRIDKRTVSSSKYCMARSIGYPLV